MKTLLLCLLSLTAFGQALITSPVVVYSDPPVTASYLLDGLTTAPVSAYSLRKLRTGYTGAAIRVRRSSDNTEQDIGFTSGGLLDQTALLSFVGSGSGFVRTWYDQKGTTHFVQTSTGNQPRIVNAGAVVLANSVPMVEAVGGSSYLDATPSITGTTLTALFVASMRSNTQSNGRLLSVGTLGSNDYDNTSSAVVLARNGGNLSLLQYRASNSLGTTNVTDGQLITITSQFDGSNAKLSVNGSQVATAASSGSFNAPLTRLFRHTGGSGESWDGYCSETLLFTNTPGSTDLATIQTSQKAFYTTP